MNVAPRNRPRRMRLDQALVEQGLVESRSRAQALILASDVLVNGVAVSKAGTPVSESDELRLKAPPRFVSRGGEKLEHAFARFALDVAGKVTADFGASTGGFVDCLLQHDAARVYALDVGYGQLAEKLRTDPRVVVMDRLNVRNLASLPEPVDLVSIDVSFIGLKLVLPAALRVLAPNGEVVALVKPQFEAGRADVGKGGVVRDPEAHRRVLRQVSASAAELGLGLKSLTASPLRGPAGNIEFLAQFRPGETCIEAESAIELALAEGKSG